MIRLARSIGRTPAICGFEPTWLRSGPTVPCESPATVWQVGQALLWNTPRPGPAGIATGTAPPAAAAVPGADGVRKAPASTIAVRAQPTRLPSRKALPRSTRFQRDSKAGA